ncbi:hypothetical protein A33K_15316 [Burkholderia humptydooensis MSMB43]|uniref:Uncharacterized protein n=1 Tax=Burkholderia humptydooensis MSMB43 TaxID=441157 RepID=A0ABN0G502_9BURK|nr:hypothetical protein A33K_15316 [Burkholderia humptydooensis MSMB43]
MQSGCGALSRRRDSRRDGILTWNNGETLTLPCAGIIQIRFKGYFSPASHDRLTERNAGPPR